MPGIVGCLLARKALPGALPISFLVDVSILLSRALTFTVTSLAAAAKRGKFYVEFIAERSFSLGVDYRGKSARFFGGRER